MVMRRAQGSSPKKLDVDADEADETVPTGGGAGEANTWICQAACCREAQCSNDSTAGFRRFTLVGPQLTTGLSSVCGRRRKGESYKGFGLGEVAVGLGGGEAAT